ncbi:cell wall-binding repeat-containing protein [Guptibacillus algicola]|uniref:cell wall-binding repeat-containing protein n=1 Tax=Guptibacillus algicola TaxID=225844 RepID=UPI001CD241CE|nr:cell wall-binding repeat-containing protein [Alkalihalobacillus algicola]MCA0986991.1 cell wall-binding repeat-containing protein [Alkalihalobacillus algicola]
MRKTLSWLLLGFLLVSGFSWSGDVHAASDGSNGLEEEIKKVKQDKSASFSEDEKKKIETHLKQKLSNDPTSIKTLGDYYENEPNDDFNQANILYMEDVVYGTFDVNDVDMYQIKVNNPIELVVAGTSQPGVDLGYLVADAYGDWLDPDFYDYYDGVEIQVYTIPEGTYYIGAIDLNGGGSEGMYALSAYNTEYIERLSGKDRYETAITIAEAGWPEGTDNVVLATGSTFPDALAGAPLAFQLDAPILLTPKAKLDSRVRDLIVDFGVKKVTILGGTGAVSAEVEKELRNKMGLEVRRLKGKNRYETAAAIAETLLPTHHAVVAYGGNFPDALSIAPYAAMYGLPIFLTDKNELSKATKDAMSSYTKTYVVGGTGAISESVKSQLPSPTRLKGKDRYDTSISITKELNMATTGVFIATGEGFADALTGSVLAAKFGEPTILTQKNKLPTGTKKFLIEENTTFYTILGGSGAVGPGVEDDIFGIE